MISVTEQLPDTKRHLLLRFHGGSISSCKYRLGRLGEPQQDVLAWCSDCCGRFGNPTHWMPLPKVTEGGDL